MPTTDRTELYTDLYSKLSETHRGTHQGSRLVALVDECERAVLFNTASRTLESTPFDKHGVYLEESEVLWRQISDPASWIDAHIHESDWVHPHYRWACDLGDEET
nr:hypothetical protein [Halogeometricum rufum]